MSLLPHKNLLPLNPIRMSLLKENWKKVKELVKCVKGFFVITIRMSLLKENWKTRCRYPIPTARRPLSNNQNVSIKRELKEHTLNPNPHRNSNNNQNVSIKRELKVSISDMIDANLIFFWSIRMSLLKENWKFPSCFLISLFKVGKSIRISLLKENWKNSYPIVYSLSIKITNQNISIKRELKVTVSSLIALRISHWRSNQNISIKRELKVV